MPDMPPELGWDGTDEDPEVVWPKLLLLLLLLLLLSSWLVRIPKKLPKADPEIQNVFFNCVS